ncbi:MAG: FGGY-family carbohydrate kinase, partial [Anaerolineae bacterium]
MGTPDVQSAAVGSGAVADFAGHLYIGTSSWLTCHVPFKKTDLFHNMGSLPSAIPERYLVANEQEMAGACLNFLRDNLLYQDDGLGSAVPPADYYERLNQAAASAPPGSNGVLFTPWLYGERTPVDDHTIRGGFYNLSLPHTRADLIRAVFEGVAYNGRWLLKYVEKFIGRQMGRLNMIGGGANSDLWCQIHADVLDRPIRQVRDPIQANARGAAFLAAAALGFIQFSDIPQLVPIARTYEPNPANRALYDGLFAEFLQLYKQNRKIYARLNKTTNGG